MQILVLTSDKTQNILPAFMHQWQKHNGLALGVPLDVYGYTVPNNFDTQFATFTSLGKFEDYPVSRWSDGFAKALSKVSDEIVMVLMDDYLMLRGIDDYAVNTFVSYMLANPEVVRFDLSSDRLYANGIQDYEPLEHYDLLISNTTIPYHFSLQSALWRTEKLRKLIVLNESPWETEFRAGERLANYPQWKVLGSRQVPMRYRIAYQGGKFTLDNGYQVPHVQFSELDLAELKSLGLLDNIL